MKKKIQPFIILMIIVLTSMGLTSCVPKGDGSIVDFGTLLAQKVPTIKEQIPENIYWPLTGLIAEDRVAVFNRPISIKVENSYASRPQTNIHRADVVIESEIEGGETRFNCIFHSDIPDIVGNVRSARMSDLWLVPQFNALFFYSGANSDVLSRIRKSVISDMGQNGGSELFYRSDDNEAPHNLYLELDKVYETARDEGFETIDANVKSMFFDPMNIVDAEGASGAAITDDNESAANTDTATNNGSASNAGAAAGKVSAKTTSGSALASDFPWTPASKIDVQFSGTNTSNWEWDATNKVYLRGQNGDPHMEATTKKQLTAKNVVVMYAVYTQMSKLDPAGSPTFDTTLGGQGRAIIFRDGMQLECQWNADAEVKPYFTDANGLIIPLDPGNTWFQIIRDGADSAKVTVK